MAIPIDPKEVLTHLNSMGFTNIGGEQLKDFIKDLKRLIKYDLANKENKVLSNKPDIYSILHETGTTSFLAKCNSKNTQYKAKLKENLRYHRNVREKKSTDINASEPSTSRSKDNLKGRKIIIAHNVYEEPESITPNESHRDDVDSLYKDEISKTETSRAPDIKYKAQICGKKKMSKAFIRPKAGPKLVHKTDPVALYHAYQAEWDKHKLHMPGETSHNRLRWSIREKMLGETTALSYTRHTPLPPRNF